MAFQKLSQRIHFSILLPEWKASWLVIVLVPTLTLFCMLLFLSRFSECRLLHQFLLICSYRGFQLYSNVSTSHLVLTKHTNSRTKWWLLTLWNLLIELFDCRRLVPLIMTNLFHKFMTFNCTEHFLSYSYRYARKRFISVALPWTTSASSTSVYAS